MRLTPEAPSSEPRPPNSTSTAGPERAGLAAPISLRGLRHSFGALEVLAGLELEVGAGDVVGLVGPSGCGKSTLLELIAGLMPTTPGEVAVGGVEADAERLARCAYMPQRDLLLPWLSALDNAALALRNRGASRADARSAAGPLLTRFGLGGFEDARPATLSGGMRQRVAFARTLLAEKPVLLLDEPLASLDAITRGELQEWLAAELAARRRTVVLVTHDVEEALYLCDRVVVLSPRPARALDEIDSPAPRTVPRDHAVAQPSFLALRERAMRALREAHG